MKYWKFLYALTIFSVIFSQDIQLQLANLDSTNGDYTIDILMISNVNIAGFQFQATGGILLDGDGGLSSENLSTITTNSNGMVLAFDFMGGIIPSGEGTLIQLTFSEITASEICIIN